MEFNSNFAIIQALLRNLDKVFGGLRNIHSENDNKVNEITAKFRKEIEEKSMTKNDLRRMFLLFLLNTDHDYEDLLQDLDYVHILDTIPKISKYLFIEFVNQLQLEEFLYESVLFLPPLLSLNVVEIYLTLLKKRDPFQLLKYVDFISRAIFVKLALLHSSNDGNNFKIKLKYFEYLQSVIENFSSTKTENFDSWEQNKLYYFTACIMKSITSVVKTCCKYFMEPIIEKESHHNIYDIKIRKEFNVEVKIKTEITENDLLENCLQLILSKFLSTAQSVTVLAWMAWMELDEFTEENLQSIIGNDVYYCLHYIKEEKVKSCINPHLYSELIAVLTNLSIRPTNEDDEIKSAGIQTILTNINDPVKTQVKWLSALISHKDFVPNISMLNIIYEKVHLLNQKDCELLFDKYIDYIQNSNSLENDENFENIKTLCKKIVLTSLQNFHVDYQIALLESFVIKHGMTDYLRLPEFDSQLTEIFNKVIDNDDRTYDFYSGLIAISLQSPKTVVEKVLKEALCNNQHGKLMVDLLKVLKPICVFRSKEASSTVLYEIINDMMVKIETLSDVEKDNFVTLVTKLINKSLIDGNEYLVSCLMPLLYDNVQNEKWSLVIFLLNILKSYIDGVATYEGFELKLPIHLVFLCQLIDKTRCTLSNYNAQRNAVCDKAIEVLTTVIESFDTDEHEIDVINWLKQELQKLNIITQMHVLSYINIPSLMEQMSKTSVELYWLKLILCGIDTDLSFLYDMRRDFFLRTLSKLLPGFTTSEWKIMFSNLVPREEAGSLYALFIVTADAVLFLEASLVMHLTELNGISDCDNARNSEAEPEVITSSASACLCFIIKNLITIVQDIIFPNAKKMTGDELAEIFIRICKVLHEFPQASQNHSSLILLKVLQDLISSAQCSVNRKERKSTVTEINKFCAGIGLIPNFELRQNLSKFISSIQFSEAVV